MKSLGSSTSLQKACVWLVGRIAATTMQPIGIQCSGSVSTRCPGNLPSHVGQRSCLPGVLRQRAHHASRMSQLPRHRQSRRRTGRCLQLHAEADPDSNSNQVQECADSPCMLSTCCTLCWQWLVAYVTVISRGSAPSATITLFCRSWRAYSCEGRSGRGCPLRWSP